MNEALAYSAHGLGSSVESLVTFLSLLVGRCPVLCDTRFLVFLQQHSRETWVHSAGLAPNVIIKE